MFPWNHNGTVLRLATSCTNAFVTSGRLRAGCFDGRVAFRIPFHMYTTLNKNPKEEQEYLKPASPTNDATIGRIPLLLNTQFKKYPLESVAALMFMEISSIYWMHQVILHSGVVVPVEFGLAFAMSRPFRRVRLPLEIAGAAVLARIAPQVTQVKLSNLSSGLPTRLKSWAAEKPRPSLDKLQAVIDQYGLAYFISARWLGASIVLGLNACIQYGVDVTPLLQTFGGSDVVPALSSWAAAVTASSVLYPVSIAASGLLSKVLAKTATPLLRSVYLRVAK